MKTLFTSLALWLILGLLVVSPARAQSGEPPVVYNPADVVPLKKSPTDFVHPGVLFSEADLLRMRAKVNAGYEPWKSGFEALRRNGSASPDYVPSKPIEFIDAAAGFAISNDAGAAFSLAMMWNITRDERYAAKAREVLLAWSGNKGSLIDTHLQLAPAGENFAVAAEILRWSYPGWRPADTDAMKAMFNRKEGAAKYSFLDVLRIYHTRNHGTINNAGLMAVGIFLSDPDLYNLAVNRYFSVKSGCGVHDIINPTTGQNTESDRDQAHSHGNIAPLGDVSRMMWVQGSNAGFEAGKDAAGVPLLVRGFQFTAAYNLGYDLESYRGWSTDPHWDTRLGTRDGVGGVSSHTRGYLTSYELIYNYYKYVSKVPAKEMNFIEEVIQLRLPERNNGEVADVGLLYFSPEARQSPLKPVKPAAYTPSDTSVRLFGRVPAAQFDAAGGRLAREKNKPGTELFDGNPVVNLTRIGNYVVYKGFQFGDFADGKAVMALRAATNNNSGNVYAAFYADVDGSLKIAGQELDPGITGGQYLGRVNLKTTGGWWDYNTFYGALENIPSGKKGDLYMVFLGQEEWRRTEWLMNVDWFKMAPRFAHDLTTVNSTLTDGKALSYPQVDFDMGAKYFHATLSSTTLGTLEIRQGDAKGPLMGQLSIPSTGGQERQMRVALKNLSTGIRPLSLVYRGAGVQLQSFHFTPLKARTQVFPASSHLATSGIDLGPKADDGNVSLQAKNEAWAAFPRVGFGTGMSRVSVHIASNTTGKIEVRTLTRDGTKIGQPISQGEYQGNSGTLIATLDIPHTGGLWQTVVAKMPTPISRVAMIFLVFRAPKENGWIRLSDFQFDPENVPPALADVSVAAPQGSVWRYALPTLDEDGDRVTATLVSAPKGATLNSQTSELTWTPKASGTFPIVVELFDGQLRSRSTINLTVQ